MPAARLTGLALLPRLSLLARLPLLAFLALGLRWISGPLLLLISRGARLTKLLGFLRLLVVRLLSLAVAGLSAFSARIRVLLRLAAFARLFAICGPPVPVRLLRLTLT